jgi:RNA polymerase sigma-70 factor (ECF subfamily)
MRHMSVTDNVAAGRQPASLAEIEMIYRKRLSDFRRVARAALGSTEAARDAVQDGFVRAIRDRAAYRGEGPLEAWVWRCVMNAVRTSERKTPRRDGATQQQFLDSPAHPEPAAPDDEVRAMINRLPERQRFALFLRYYADLDYAGIAEALEISAGTVAASLHAAHQSLRQALAEASQ